MKEVSKCSYCGGTICVVNFDLIKGEAEIKETHDKNCVSFKRWPDKKNNLEVSREKHIED